MDNFMANFDCCGLSTLSDFAVDHQSTCPCAGRLFLSGSAKVLKTTNTCQKGNKMTALRFGMKKKK